MSDHCTSCIPEFRDLVGITKPEEFAQGLAAMVLCEGCGPTQVDPEGYCLGGCVEYFSGKPHKCRHCAAGNCPFHIWKEEST